RHTPYMVQPEYRIYEMNKRLQSRTEDSDNLWWDAFATEFFEDDATLTLSFCLEDGPKRYTIGRTLIPRYFSTVFEGGVTDLYYILKHSKESYHNSSITVDCDQCTMVTQHGKPMFTKVCTEGRLILEFTFDDLMRIKTWHFTIRQYRELVPRSILAMHAQDPQVLEQLSKNITRMGLTNFTLNYLRLPKHYLCWAEKEQQYGFVSAGSCRSWTSSPNLPTLIEEDKKELGNHTD
ncbi:hypothetical protein HGM15179_005993, partial [Zosterops borbonicus]